MSEGVSGCGQHTWQKRLCYIGGCAGLNRSRATRFIAPRRQHYDRYSAISLVAANELSYLKPMHIRHVQVEDHQIYGRKREMFYCFKAARSFVKVNVFEVAQRCYNHSPHGGRIIYDENAFHFPARRESSIDYQII